MRQTGRQSLLYKVRKFDTLGTDKELATRVLHILEPYTVEQVSSASAGAGTFYNWVGHILIIACLNIDITCISMVRLLSVLFKQNVFLKLISATGKEHSHRSD